ncbi:MAG: hypothetical protein BAJALOKI3v1_40050 [Promethearchaeota archaeon]|nr:MAG: hypothetical protein BAJALOKI3v1_40050 [Candidatus Lokiarchaeota archaeon]
MNAINNVIPVVEVDKLNVSFGDAHIIHDVSFEVNEGELIGLFI